MHNDKTSKPINVRNLTILFLGSIIISFGIAMYLKAGFGTDPLTTFVVGVSKVFGISVGRASQLSMSCVLIIIFFFERKLIGIGTFVNAFLTGELLNFFMNININNSSILLRSLIMTVGIITFAVGLAMFVISELGLGPVDSIMIILKDKFNISVEKSRIVLDIALVSLGALLGAELGVGTILGTLLTGVIMGKIIKLYRSYNYTATV